MASSRNPLLINIDSSRGGRPGGIVGSWDRRDWWEFGRVAAAIALLHILGFGTLLLLVVPHHYQVGSQVFGVGLGITAYTLGLRHAFDADHIAAIDNVTRKLTSEGAKPKSVGFWFALGHALLVFGLAILIVFAARIAGELLRSDSSSRHLLGLVGTLGSGFFLYLIAVINIVALVGIWKVFTAMRHGELDEDKLEEHLANRGLLARVLRPVMSRVSAPVQMLPVGALFGLGFDTATEVALLALAGTGAAAGLPWYALLTLPVLFAAGMTLMDTIDGLFMTVAYEWAFANPVRKVYYNLTITGLSVVVAVLIGSISVAGVLHDEFGFGGAITEWAGAIDPGKIGFAIVAAFVATWVCAVGYWKLAGVGQHWHVNLPSPRAFGVLDEVVCSRQTWPVVAAKYGVEDPLPPWKTSLEGFIKVLDRRADTPGPAQYTHLPFPEDQLMALAHSLLDQEVIDEGDLRQRLTTVRARLEA